MFRSQDHQTPAFKYTLHKYPHRINSQTPIHKADNKEKGVENNTKDTKRDFSKISPTFKCYKCQSYGHVAANCPSPFKITINDRVSIETPKPDSTISPKDTDVIKEFSIFYSVDTTTVSFAAATVTCQFSFPALANTTFSSSTPIPTVITCFGHQPL